MSNACNTSTVLSGPRTPVILLSLSVTLGFISGYNNYLLYCWYLRQGFPIDFSGCIYLIFLFRPFSRSLISYFARLVCGWSRTRETCVDGFFPGVGWIKEGMRFFLYHS